MRERICKKHGIPLEKRILVHDPFFGPEIVEWFCPLCEEEKVKVKSRKKTEIKRSFPREKPQERKIEDLDVGIFWGC